MKWRCQMCGTIVEADEAPHDCTGCKFRNRYLKYEGPDKRTVVVKNGQTVYRPIINVDESKIIHGSTPGGFVNAIVEKTDDTLGSFADVAVEKTDSDKLREWMRKKAEER